jgi:hypothetical protein
MAGLFDIITYIIIYIDFIEVKPSDIIASGVIDLYPS